MINGQSLIPVHSLIHCCTDFHMCWRLTSRQLPLWSDLVVWSQTLIHLLALSFLWSSWGSGGVEGCDHSDLSRTSHTRRVPAAHSMLPPPPNTNDGIRIHFAQLQRTLWTHSLHSVQWERWRQHWSRKWTSFYTHLPKSIRLYRK